MIRHEEITDIHYATKTQGMLKKLEREMRKTRIKLTSNPPYVKPKRLPTDLKFILKWTIAFGHYTSTRLKNGQEVFIEENCTYYNCFLTHDVTLLLEIRNFDAILFDVDNTWSNYPRLRSPHQTYIFVATESANNYPMCHSEYENYFNRTWTYKLDSDIRWSYITVLDKNGTVVGPKINMEWKNPMDPVSDEVKARLAFKKKAAAWFVSYCNAKSERSKVARQISGALAKHGYDIDIYGACGKLSCPRNELQSCLGILERSYYFYLAFENSLCEDYVTEKLLYATQHYTVPIVFGGANYSRYVLTV